VSAVSQILVAYLLDLAMGDPPWLPHPVRFWGRVISWWEKEIMPRISSPGYQRVWGTVFALTVLLFAFAASWGSIYVLAKINPLLGAILSIYLISTTVTTHELGTAAKRVKEALLDGNLGQARNKVGEIVARDTGNLPKRELVRATVESVAENTVDGIIAPIFYAFLGGAPLAMLYRAANTLDSRLGYKNMPYRYWGWASARIDDILNYVPARLSHLIIPAAAFALGKHPTGWLTIRRDGRKHPSPNSGIPEAGMAGALGVRLGGYNYYQGRREFRPYLGDDNKVLDTFTIKEAVRISYLSSMLTLALGSLVLIGFSKIA